MASGRSGISTVLGGILAVAIILTTVIPLLMYMRQVGFLYDTVSSDRRRADEEKMDEKLSAVAYLDVNYAIMLNITNTCDLSISVIRIWVMPRDGEPIGIDAGLTLAPRTPTKVFDTGCVAVKGRLYDLKLVTERGNIIVPEGSPLQIIEPYTPPPGAWIYSLAVTIVETHAGRTYNILVDGSQYYNQHVSAGNDQAISIVIGWNEPGEHSIKVTSELLGNKDVRVLFDDIIPIPPNQAIVLYD